MFLLVRARHEPLGPIKFYNFSIVAHDLPAGIEGGKLTEGGTTAYMCAVLNQAGTVVAHWDLFSFDHEQCIKDCVMASIPLEITFNPDNISGVEKDNEWFCNACFSFSA